MRHRQRTASVWQRGIVIAPVLALAVAACGSASSATVSPTCATSTADARNGSQGASQQTISGDIVDITGAILNLTGTTPTIHLTGSTHITSFTLLPASSLTSGSFVIVLLDPGTTGLPSARSIIVQSDTQCRAPTATNFGGIVGTISSYTASTQQLAIIDAQGASYLIGFTSDTTIGSPVTGTKSDLGIGETVIVRGKVSGNSMTASTVQILSSATSNA